MNKATSPNSLSPSSANLFRRPIGSPSSSSFKYDAATSVGGARPRIDLGSDSSDDEGDYIDSPARVSLPLLPIAVSGEGDIEQSGIATNPRGRGVGDYVCVALMGLVLASMVLFAIYLMLKGTQISEAMSPSPKAE